MEEDLDEISRGERESLDFLARVLPRRRRQHRGLEQRVEQDDENADYPAARPRHRSATAASRSASASAASARSCSAAKAAPGNTASLPDDVAPADLTVEQALELVRAKAEGPRTLGVDPATGQNVYVMNGRFGAYVQLGETPEKGEQGDEAEARVAAGEHDANRRSRSTRR